MTFVMVVTYTNFGVRLSCSEFEDLLWHDHSILENIKSLVKEHLQVGYFFLTLFLTLTKNQRTEQEVNNSYTVTKSYFGWNGPPQD
jgi:hypothetical protein